MEKLSLRELKKLKETSNQVINICQHYGTKPNLLLDLVSIFKRILTVVKFAEWRKVLEKEKVPTYKHLATKRTLLDIKDYKQKMDAIKQPDMSEDDKIFAAIWIKSINSLLKILKKRIGEREFTMFYNYYFRNESSGLLAYEYGVDISTVTRRNSEALEIFTTLQYPDLVLKDILLN